MSYSSAYQPMVNAMTRPETSNPIPAAEMIHETLRTWRSERAQAWWRRMWRWIFSA
jgi:hypothetical protein